MRALALCSACMLLLSLMQSMAPRQLHASVEAVFSRPHTAQRLARAGDEIVVCGQLFHSGAPVVTWMDPGGYDAYRVETRFTPLDKSSWEDASGANPGLKHPNRFDTRKEGLSPEQLECIRGGGWDLPLLQRVVDQFVLHYDQSGTSRRCFRTLHDQRCLSIHFMLDLDGTIYQTLDLKERAWHATTSNTRSIGIEIANPGAWPAESPALAQWYAVDNEGRTAVKIPPDGGVRTPDFVARPARDKAIAGSVQGQDLVQYDLTPQQYDSLIKLTATLCQIFPQIRCDYPRDSSGNLIREKLSDDELHKYRGVLGHYHVQANKVDPGPALQWDRIIDEARLQISR
jgi:N-acetylmuramoyl-L-alanine amidase